jgi:hypothetical protein
MKKLKNEEISIHKICNKNKYFGVFFFLIYCFKVPFFHLHTLRQKHLKESIIVMSFTEHTANVFAVPMEVHKLWMHDMIGFKKVYI